MVTESSFSVCLGSCCFDYWSYHGIYYYYAYNLVYCCSSSVIYYLNNVDFYCLNIFDFDYMISFLNDHLISICSKSLNRNNFRYELSNCFCLSLILIIFSGIDCFDHSICYICFANFFVNFFLLVFFCENFFVKVIVV